MLHHFKASSLSLSLSLPSLPFPISSPPPLSYLSMFYLCRTVQSVQSVQSSPVQFPCSWESILANTPRSTPTSLSLSLSLRLSSLTCRRYLLGPGGYTIEVQRVSAISLSSFSPHRFSFLDKSLICFSWLCCFFVLVVVVCCYIMLYDTRLPFLLSSLFILPHPPIFTSRQCGANAKEQNG